MSTTLFIFIIVAVIFFSLIIFLVFKSPKKRRDSAIDYTSALNYLLTGEQQKALQKLKDAVRNNTANIDAYIKIGDILRNNGQIDRATKIHRGLTVRNGLETYERIDIYKSLIEDYRADKKYERALLVCERLLELTRNELWVQEMQLNLYEECEDWDKAFEIRKLMLRHQLERNDSLLALYKVQAGLKLTRESKERDGRLKYREAIKIDKKCTPAYLYLSDSYIRESRLNDALTELKKFIGLVPHQAYLAFDRIKEILFETGNFGEIESIYNNLLHEHPEINSIRFALADIYERKGDFDKAIGLCQQELEANNESILAMKYLIKFYTKINEKHKALDLTLKLIDNSLKIEAKFTCEVCNFTSHEPHWRCPNCNEWNSFVY